MDLKKFEAKFMLTKIKVSNDKFQNLQISKIVNAKILETITPKTKKKVSKLIYELCIACREYLDRYYKFTE